MATTNFTNGVTLTDAGWFNDVNDAIYDDVANIKNSEYGAVGDGSTDDSAAFQLAVDSGKKIQLNAGETYKITQQIEITENLWIEGNGAKILFTPDNAFFLYNAAADAITSFVVKELTIETNAAPRASSTADVIRVLGSSFVRIENCNIIGGNIRVLAATSGGVIKNNRITGTNTAGNTTLLYGIYCATGKKYQIEGNVIDTFTTDGIKCGEPTTTVPTPGYYRVIGNDISDCLQNGIDVYDAGRLSVISSNIIHGTCSSGLEIKSEPLAGGNADNSNQVVLNGNVINNTGALGVLLSGSSYALNGNVIVGAFSESAVRVGSAGDNTETAYMRDISITGNVMENSDAGTTLIIRQNKNNVVVTGNTFVGTGTRTGTGVTVSDTEGGRVSITSNSFRNLNFAINFQTYADAALNFSDNFLENINSVAQIADSLETAWVRITGNIATNINTAPIAAAGAGAPGHIIRENSWQKAGPITISQTIGNVGTGEDDLLSYDLPASTLQRDRQTLRITAWGVVANNANAKTVKLYFGSAAIQTTAMTTGSAAFWKIQAEVIRTGSSTQTYTSQLAQGGATVICDIERGNLTQTDTAAITIKCTGTATADNDIQQYGMIVEPVNY